MVEIITDDDLASYPGVPAGVDLLQALELANGLVGDIVGVLDPVPTQVKTIALEVAKRGLVNEHGASSVTTGIDDWKKTVRWEGEDREAGFYLTEREENKLRGYVFGSSHRVGSIRLRVPR